MHKTTDWLFIRHAAFTYMGTIVGAGFATGREITEFFTQYGIWGTFGIFVAGFTFIFLGMKIMLVAVKTNTKNMHSFLVYIMGEKLGTIFNFLITIMIFGVTTVMLSGAGALFEEQLQLSRWIGVLLMVVLCYISISRGIQGLHRINGFIVPFMILFSLTIFLLSKSSISYLIYMETKHSYLWLFKALIYATFNLSLSLAVLIPLAHQLRSPDIIKKSSLAGGLGLTFLLLFNHFAISKLPHLQSIEIPTAQLLVHYDEWLHFAFICIILGEIFSTLAANSFGIAELCYEKKKIPKKFTLLFLLILCAVCSSFQYSTLIAIIYPLFGMIGIIFLIRLIWI